MSYSVGSVKIELAAGKVTKVMPWTSPARLTTRLSALDAMSGVPASSSDFSAGARGLLRTVQHDVRHVLAVVGPGKPFRCCCRCLDGGRVVAVEIVPGPGEECVSLAVHAAEQHRVYAQPARRAAAKATGPST